jgi:hypothetical protein
MFHQARSFRALARVFVAALMLAAPIPSVSAAGGTIVPSPTGIRPVFAAGLSNPGALKVHNGDLTVTTNGAVVQNLEIRGQLLIKASNVHVRNVRVYGSSVWVVKIEGSATLENMDIGHPSHLALGGIVGGPVTGRNLDIHDVEDGIKLASDSYFENVHIHHLDSPQAKPHSDAVQVQGATTNAEIRNSILDARGPDGVGNAAIIIKSDFGKISNIRLVGNSFDGGNYMTYIRDGGFGMPTNVTFEDNSFGSNYRFGYVSKDGPVNWINNYVAATGEYIDSNGKPTDPLPVEQGTRPCKSGPCDAIGVVDRGGRWRLYDALSAGAKVNSFYYGNPGDVAFMGDWDGDGVATPGLYRRSDGFAYLRSSNTQGNANLTFFFGNPGDIPLVGDFNGDGKDTVSIYRPSQAKVYIINRLGTNGGGLGAADFSFYFGKRGDVPFVGDFNGNGKDSLGLHRPSTGLVYFRNSLTAGKAEKSFVYGNPGDVILAGDWDGDGDDSVAVYRPSNGRLYVNLQNAPGAASYSLRVGRYPLAVGWGRH